MSTSFCQLEAVFCDEIRIENNGKKIFIGVYSSAMLVDAFPATLPRLTVSLNLLLSSNRHPKDSLRFVLLMDEAVLAESEVPADLLSEMRVRAAERAHDETSIGRLTVEFNLTPFKVPSPCKLRVRAHADGHEIKTAGLSIQPAAVTDDGEPKEE